MKRLALLIFLIVASAIPAWSQQTAVTATVTDPNGHAYSSGTSSASLVCAGNAQAYSGSYPIPRSVPTVGLDGNGAFSQILYDTSQLVDVNHNPLSCHYTYSVTEQCGVASFTTGALTGITGAGPVDLSTQINSFAVPLSPKCTVGYGGYVYIGPLAGIPAFCVVGQTAFITDATPGRNQYNCTSTNVWTQNTGGGAGNPCVITALSYQFNNSGSFGCALLTQDAAATTVTNTGILNNLGSTIFGGISPWADIKAFGANPRSGVSFDTTTATTTSGSPTVHLTSAIDFKNNEWVVLPAGNPNTNSAPSAPISVASTTVSGTTSITYTLVGRIDSPTSGIGPGGLTPVSAGTSTANSPTIFGPVPIAISSATASGGVVTVNSTGINCTTSTHIHVLGLSGSGSTWNGYFLPTTGGTNSCVYSVSGATGTATVTGATVKLTNAAIPTSITRSTSGVFSITTDIAHNYVATSAPNQTILILELSSTADCNGQYLIATASGNSITTTATGLTPATTETCGLVVGQTFVEVREKNVITGPAYANGITQYYVYSNNAAATTQPIGETDIGSVIFTDYGPAVTNQFVPPPYVPSTPPVADTNSLWVGQIQSGAGTTTLTMSTNVPTTQSTPVLAEHDDGQAILEACNSMSESGVPGGGTVLVSAPNTYTFGKYVVNYPLTLPRSCGLSLATRLVENETLTLSYGGSLISIPAPTFAGTPAQGGNSYAVINGIANPLVATANGSFVGNVIDGINFVASSSQQRMLYIRDQSSVVRNSAFQANGECYATDIVYEGQYGGIQQLNHNTFNTACTSVPPVGGYMPEQPAIWIRADTLSGGVPGQFSSDGANQWNGGGVMVDSRLRTTNPVLNFHFLGINEVQEPTTPFLYAYGGNISGDGDWEASGVLMDSQGEACFGALAPNVANVWITGCDVSASAGNIVTGNSIAGLTIANPTTIGHVGSTLYNLISNTGVSTSSLNILGPSASAPLTFTGTLIDMGSANATLDLSGNLTVASCTGCGGGISYPGAGIPLSSGSAWLTSVNYLSALTGQVLVATNAAAPTFASKGIAGRTVSGATDTILCDSSTATQDRTATIMYTDASGTTVTVPDAGSSGCGSNFVFAVIAGPGSGTVTFNRTTSSTFTVVNGSSATGGATSFTLTAGQFATVSSPDNSNWLVRLGTATAAAVNSVSGDGVLITNSVSTGAVTLTLASAAASTVFGNCTSGSATPTFCSITSAMLPASSAAPNENVWYVSPNCTSQPNCSFAYFDAQYVFDATWSNAATPVAITCPSSDCNFVPTDTGKACWGITGAAPSAPLGTFTYVGAQAGTCSGTSTGPATANGKFIWGHDDTTNLTSAWAAYTARPYCGTFLMPQGITMLGGAVGSQTFPAACIKTGTFQGEYGGADIRGQARQSTQIVPSPGFSFTNCSAFGCFFSPPGASNASIALSNFTINGLGQTLSGVSTSPAGALVGVNVNGTVQHVYLLSWANSTSPAVAGIEFTGQSDYAIDLAVDAFGSSAGISAGGDGLDLFDCYAGDMGNGAGISIASGALVNSYGSGWGPTNSSHPAVENAGASATFNEYGDFYEQGIAGTYGLQVSGSSITNLNAVKLGGPGAAATNYGIVFSGAATVTAQSSGLFGGSTNGWIQGSTGTFIDQGGNTFSGAFNYTGGYFGSASITGKTLATSGVALTSGWSSSTVTAAAGDSHSMTFTITLAGTPSTGAVATVTFPTAYNAAPKNCFVSNTGGTQTLTGITVGTPTVTTVTLTYAGTLTAANTIIEGLVCQ